MNTGLGTRFYAHGFHELERQKQFTLVARLIEIRTGAFAHELNHTSTGSSETGGNMDGARTRMRRSMRQWARCVEYGFSVRCMRHRL